MRVVDYIAEFLVANGINNIFMITGGNAMYLNDAFGHHQELKCVFFHHEQACAMAAEAYSRYTNKPAVVCVTNGPGATNTITGVLCSYMGSIPMIIISGQCRYDTTIHTSNIPLRTKGIQEIDITSLVKNITKYSVIVKDEAEVKNHLRTALIEATSRRKGPVWIDVPLDVQYKELDLPVDYITEIKAEQSKDIFLEEIKLVINKIKESKAPIIIAGNGIRLGNAIKEFKDLIHRLNIPVVNTMSSIDVLPHDDELYIGLTGITGSRAGNYAVQNSDLVISLGSRLSFTEIGFNYLQWAPNAYKIAVDIDLNELEKDTLSLDMKICCDVKLFIEKFITLITKIIPKKEDWTVKCHNWKEKFPLGKEKFFTGKEINPYGFYHTLNLCTSEDDVIVASVGTARVMSSQAIFIRKEQRFITNVPTASMGYGLPAGIGVCIARKRERTILITGEGSLQMNIQELQTIIHHKYPLYIFVINNGGYKSIIDTQNNYFKKPLIGVGDCSGDLSFPNLKKIANAYGLRYKKIAKNKNLEVEIKEILEKPAPVICEVKVLHGQSVEPKVAAKKMSNGNFLSATLDMMYPYLEVK